MIWYYIYGIIRQFKSSFQIIYILHFYLLLSDFILQIQLRKLHILALFSVSTKSNMQIL